MKKLIYTILILFSTVAAMAQSEDGVWTLKECVDYALNNNLDIRQSLLNLQTSEVNARQSKYTLFPSLSARSDGQNNWGRSIDPTTNQFIAQEFQRMSISAGSSVLLFNGFNLMNQLRQAEQNMIATQYDLESSKNFIVLSLVGIYMNVIFNQELLDNALAQLNSTQQQVVRTQKQVDAGALPISNLLDLQAQQATNELNVINQENALNLSLLQLKQILQLPASTDLQIDIPVLDPDEDPLNGLNVGEVYAAALTEMPEIKAAEYRATASAFGVKSARGTLYPSLSASGGLSTNYSSFFAELKPFSDQINENISFFAGLSLSIPIFNGFNAQSNLQRAQINQNRNNLALEQAKNDLRQSIESAFNDAVAAAKTYVSTQKQVDAREESFRATEQRYNLGSADFVEYQVAENDLFRSRSDLLRGKYDLILKIKILDFYQGNPLEF